MNITYTKSDMDTRKGLLSPFKELCARAEAVPRWPDILFLKLYSSFILIYIYKNMYVPNCNTL